MLHISICIKMWGQAWSIGNFSAVAEVMELFEAGMALL